MMRVIAMALLALMGTSVLPAQVREEARQDRRIEQGERSGQLTPREANRLERRQKRDQAMTRRDRRDGGGLTAQERRQASRRDNRLNRDIYRQKHDQQARPQ